MTPTAQLVMPPSVQGNPSPRQVPSGKSVPAFRWWISKNSFVLTYIAYQTYEISVFYVKWFGLWIDTSISFFSYHQTSFICYSWLDLQGIIISKRIYIDTKMNTKNSWTNLMTLQLKFQFLWFWEHIFRMNLFLII